MRARGGAGPRDHHNNTQPSPSIQPVGAVREPPYQPNQHHHHRITPTRQYPIPSIHANVPDVGAGFKPALLNHHQPITAATPSSTTIIPSPARRERERVRVRARGGAGPRDHNNNNQSCPSIQPVGAVREPPYQPNNHQPITAATPSPQRARSTQKHKHLPPHLSPLPLGGRGLG